MENPLVDVLTRQGAHRPKTVSGLVKLLYDVVTRGYRRQGKLPELVPETGSLGDEPGAGGILGDSSPETAKDDWTLLR